MGPGDRFFEDESGQVLYVNTPNGRVEIGRKPTSEQADKDYKQATRIGFLFAAIVLVIIWYYYFFINQSPLTYDIKTNLPVPWAEESNFQKNLVVIYFGAVPALIAWIIAVLGVLFYKSMRRINHQQFRKALKESNKIT